MIVITGGTGTVGTALVEELAARRGVAARVLVRSAARAAELERRGLEPVLGSFDDDGAVRRALRGAERLFLLSPAGDAAMVAAQTRLVDLAVRAGVRHVVKLSSIGADEDTGARIVRAHRAIERHVEASGLAWTHLRPHWFMQNELGNAAAVTAHGAFAAPDVTRISMIDARDVAAAAARVLTGEGHEGRAYVLTGPQLLSYADVARAWSRVLGHPVRWTPVTLEDARDAMLGAGLPPELAEGFAEIMAGYRTGTATARVSPDAQRLLGRPPRSFEAFLREHRDRLPAVDAAA